MVEDSQICVVTWNIGLLTHSFSKPYDYDVSLVDVLVKELKKCKADIIAIQEIPSPLILKLLAKELDMTATPTAMSHAGPFAILYSSRVYLHDLEKFDPCLRALFSLGSISFEVLAVHLPHTKQGAELRFRIIEFISKKIELDHTILMGDMNMREAETRPIIDLGWDDAYWKSEKKKEHQYTWDSNTNLFRDGGFGFNVRFDRVFTKNYKIIEFELIGNKPLSSNPNHFLSDHFGIRTTLEFD